MPPTPAPNTTSAALYARFQTLRLFTFVLDVYALWVDGRHTAGRSDVVDTGYAGQPVIQRLGSDRTRWLLLNEVTPIT